MLVAQLNDAIRTLSGIVRVAHDDVGDGWRRWAASDGTSPITYLSATTFKAGGANYTTTFAVGRRVRASGNSTGDIKGNITASSYSAPDTTVTVVWDSGSLSSETLAVYLGPQITSSSLPHKKSVAANGYLSIPQGGTLFFLFWGTDTTASDGSGTVTCTPNFGTRIVAYDAHRTGLAAGNEIRAYGGGTTGFSVQLVTTSTGVNLSAAVQYTYWALGY
jgi:hypothetical protein